MLTPMQIQNHEFKKGFRGYNEEDVQDFMKQVADDYQILFRDNREMKETIEQLRKQVEECKKRENTAIQTLMVAQETAENVKEVARKEAENIVREAEVQKSAMIAETAGHIRDGKQKYAKLRNEVAVFRAKMESLMQAHLQLLNQMELPVVEESSEAVVEEQPCIMADDVQEQVVETVVQTEEVN